MGRARSPDSEKAEELYNHGKGKSLVEIASQLNVSAGTVRSWKNRYNWDDDSNATLQKNKRNVAKEKKAVAEAVEQVINNPDLTDKQRLFCCIYVKCFNATRAYQKAYGCDYNTALSIGYRLLENVGVREEIKRLKQNRLNREMFNESDLFQKYMEIAYADITDFTEFGNEEVEFTDKSGEERKVKISIVNIKNDSEIDGTLISEVSKGKDGVKVKLLDKMKAMGWLTTHMNFATEEQRAKIELIKANIDRIKNDSDPGDDGGVEIINDAPKETGEDIRDTDTEVSTDI